MKWHFDNNNTIIQPVFTRASVFLKYFRDSALVGYDAPPLRFQSLKPVAEGAYLKRDKKNRFFEVPNTRSMGSGKRVGWERSERPGSGFVRRARRGAETKKKRESRVASSRLWSHGRVRERAPFGHAAGPRPARAERIPREGRAARPKPRRYDSSWGRGKAFIAGVVLPDALFAGFSRPPSIRFKSDTAE